LSATQKEEIYRRLQDKTQSIKSAAQYNQVPLILMLAFSGFQLVAAMSSLHSKTNKIIRLCK